MGDFADYLELELLDHVMGVGAYAQPSGIYIGLSTADPLDDESGLAEPVGNGYARKQHDNWLTAAGRLTKNDGVIEFAEATGSWGIITHYGIFDAVSGGNMLGHGLFPSDPTVVSGDNLSIKDQDITVKFLSAGVSTYLTNALLDHVFLVAAYTPASNLYVAFTTAAVVDGNDGSTITEPSGGAYARKLHNSWNAAAAGATSNNGAIAFVEATAAWGIITYVAILDALTGGNLLLFGALDSSLDVNTGDQPNFPDGDLDITLD